MNGDNGTLSTDIYWTGYDFSMALWLPLPWVARQGKCDWDSISMVFLSSSGRFSKNPSGLDQLITRLKLQLPKFPTITSEWLNSLLQTSSRLQRTCSFASKSWISERAWHSEGAARLIIVTKMLFNVSKQIVLSIPYTLPYFSNRSDTNSFMCIDYFPNNINARRIEEKYTFKINILLSVQCCVLSLFPKLFKQGFFHTTPR